MKFGTKVFAALLMFSSLSSFANEEIGNPSLHAALAQPTGVAVVPYSPIRIVGDTAYLSGMLPFDPANPGKLKHGDIETLTQQVIQNIQAVLRKEGLSLNNIVKTTVFMTHLREFEDMNKAYLKMFGNNAHLPARSTIQVAALPLGSRIEIECVAYLGKR